MEQFFSLLTLQAQLALLMIIGIWFSKKGIINDQGRKCLTDLVIDIVLPCNILQSFRIDLTLDMLRSALSILIVSTARQPIITPPAPARPCSSMARSAPTPLSWATPSRRASLVLRA